MCKRLNEETLEHFSSRLVKIESASQRRWGKLEPNELMAHLTRSIDISLGRVPQEDKSNVLTRGVGRWLIFDSPLPWPKGKIKAPGIFFPENHGDLEKEKAAAIDAMHRFVAALKSDPNERHRSMYFGDLPLSYWSKINGRHTEHHLQQFGV